MKVKIKNKKQLAKTKLRKDVLEILEAGLNAIQLKPVLKNKIRVNKNYLIIDNNKFDLNSFEKIGIIGFGKGSLEIAKYLENTLKNRITGGVIIDLKKEKLKYLKSYQGTHPLPSFKNQLASKKLITFAKSLNPSKDLLIAVVCGGGSSLFFDPLIKPKDLVLITSDLLKSGADISQINIVRKHLSNIKGGKLAKMLYPLKTIVLVSSDVIGDNLSTIASGPFYPDFSTTRDALKILKKYQLFEKYQNRLKLKETIKDKKYFKNIKHFIILNNLVALKAMEIKAQKMNYKPVILTTKFNCEAKNSYQKIQKMIKGKVSEYNLFLLGGETFVKVQGFGKGGRNEEAVLGALRFIKDDELFISCASDGIDNTPFAGALADKITFKNALRLRLKIDDYLKNNDSYNFFKKTGDYLLTGFTNSNVSDIMIYYQN